MEEYIQALKMQQDSHTWIWPQGYKTLFMLNSVEHELLNAHKYKNIKKFGFFLG